MGYVGHRRRCTRDRRMSLHDLRVRESGSLEIIKSVLLILGFFYNSVHYVEYGLQLQLK